MPFSKTIFNIDGNEKIIDKNEWTWIYNNWIKKAVEVYPNDKIECVRSSLKPGNFVKGIVENLINSDIVIADLTGMKANVYYELGIRHGIRNGNIIIAQDIKLLPSDLSSYYCYCYDYSSHNHKNETYYELFKKNIHKILGYTLDHGFKPDNPVADYKQQPKSFKKNIPNSLFKELIKKSPEDHLGLKVALSLYRDEFSWIYDCGENLIKDLNSDISKVRKADRIDYFLYVLERTFNDQNQIKFFSLDSQYQKNYSQNYRILRVHLTNIKDKFLS